ncbi:MAG: RagB/SusD family nutrient uptake outer membrane protein [Chloroherpetonaceae bacterium]|nr:RagB/SusD family nutrient uptake outer membrane protein [Chloroherpetonaceae bacterium]MDW8467292.1 RagB/SusD family nutrient uptake outer membrane protein [Chloroherpetonaceae bacterium]
MKKVIAPILAVLLLVVVSSCADLNVNNPNNPDTRRVLATPQDLQGIVAGAFVTLYNPYIGYQNNVHMEWAADYVTMTNAFRGFWTYFKVEPRIAWDNTLANANGDIASIPFQRWHAAVSSANDVIRAIEIEGKSAGARDVNAATLAGAYFVRAMALGYLANTFDKAYIVSPTQDLSQRLDFSDYRAVMAEAQRSFDRVIRICDSVNFTLPANFINTPSAYTSDQFGRLARTYAANFLVQNARNRRENSQTDWNRVLQLTERGMTQDYVINLDGNNWENWFVEIAGLTWYWRTDHRVIRIMDPTYPTGYPATGTLRRADSTLDARMRESTGYFRYEPSLGFFRLDRGPQLRSHYRFSRYDDLYNANGIGPCVFLYAETNRLLRAEALAMLGRVPEAVEILNQCRRVTVGRRPPLPPTASRDEVLRVIFDERDIELMMTDYGLHFKDMRRRDALQRGTLLHFPVPAVELAARQEPLYTYGGGNGDGVNTADGSNSWLGGPNATRFTGGQVQP